jgi:hypothetical protein
METRRSSRSSTLLSSLHQVQLVGSQELLRDLKIALLTLEANVFSVLDRDPKQGVPDSSVNPSVLTFSPFVDNAPTPVTAASVIFSPEPGNPLEKYGTEDPRIAFDEKTGT